MPAPAKSHSLYFVYIIRTSADTLYTGITTDLSRRWQEHSNSNKGSKYLKAIRPLEIAAAWEIHPGERDIQGASLRSVASKLESRIKSLTREEKLRLIRRPSTVKRFDCCIEFGCHPIHASRRKAIQQRV